VVTWSSNRVLDRVVERRAFGFLHGLGGESDEAVVFVKESVTVARGGEAAGCRAAEREESARS
jgi:hypothetical protein